MRALLVAVALMGCGASDVCPWFTWRTPTTPVAELADGSADPVWTAMVTHGREVWEVALAKVHCNDPFEGVDTAPVELIPADQWTGGSYNGYTTNELIAVRGTVQQQLDSLAYETILPHEFGHALGLEHVDPAVDPLSVMISPACNTTPSDRDVQRAAANIGCVIPDLP